VIVMKFGGTSLGSAERIASVADRVRERLDRKPVVVVSALSRVTDLLIRTAHMALDGDSGWESAVYELLARHHAVVSELLPPGREQDRLFATIDAVTMELRGFYTAVQSLGELTPRTLDAIAAVGERVSHEMVTSALQARGIPGQAVDARALIVTDESFGRATPILDETAKRVREVLLPILQAGSVPVLPGFIASTRKGVTTTLGRGGSDWSAAVLGATLPAEEIQIWTDVDGMMTVDPKVVPGAKVMAEATFDEAAELAYFGAKVLHPATIKPAVERGIPVRILNSLNPTAPGTLIASRGETAQGQPRAIAFKKGISVVLISQPRMLMAYGFVAKVFEVFDRHRTPVDLIATSEVSISLTVDDPESLPLVERDLAGLGDVKVLRGMAIVSVVGRGFMRQHGLAGQIFQALREVNIVMISFGASDVNVSFVVADDEAEKAVRLLHREFFEAA
jgi:aspartate kinase